MEIGHYLKPVDVESLEIANISKDSHLLYNYVTFFDGNEPQWDNVQIALIGVPESRAARNNSDTRLAPDEIRRQFYGLYSWSTDVKIMDLGNIIPGNTVEDTYEIVAELLAFLINERFLCTSSTMELLFKKSILLILSVMKRFLWRRKQSYNLLIITRFKSRTISKHWISTRVDCKL